MQSKEDGRLVSSPPLSLVLEDDKSLAQAYLRVLESLGYDVILSHSVSAARTIIRDRAPDLILVDIDLPDGNGLDLMNELRNDTRRRFVVISGDSSQRAAIKSIRHRAVQLILKPVSLKELKEALAPHGFKTKITDSGPIEDCWIKFGGSPCLVALRTAISYCAEHGRGHALVVGENGVEKPSVASEVHRRGRRSGSCVVVDCSLEGGSASLIRMFGQEDPATGEVLHAGYIDQATAGTLVLDYVEHLSKDMQSRLMPLLDSGSFRRIGALHGAQATLAIVGIAREQGTVDGDESSLRSDFFFRLAKTTLSVPNLSECSDDIEEIAEHLLRAVSANELHKPSFSAASLAQIRNYKWTRNVRELRNLIQRSIATTQKGSPVELIDPPIRDSVISQSAIAPWIGCTVWEMEKQLLEATLVHCNGDKEMTAQTLGMSLKSLYNRINTYR